VLELRARNARADEVDRGGVAVSRDDDAGARRRDLLGLEVADAAAGARDDEGLAGLGGEVAGVPAHDCTSMLPVDAICSWWWMTSATMKLRNFSANAG